MVRNGYGLLAIEFNIFVEVLAMDQIESQLRNGLIQRIRQLSPHLPEQPVESSPYGQRICKDLIFSVVVFDEIDERFLGFVFSLADVDKFLLVKLVKIVQMENLLREQRKPRAIKVLLSVIVLGRCFGMTQYLNW